MSLKMAIFRRVAFLVVTIAIALVYNQYHEISKPLPVPDLDLNQYWGPGQKSDEPENTKISIKEISYSKDIIQNLRNRLNETLFLHEALEGVGFEYGVNSKTAYELMEYWRDNYLPRWASRENYLNQLPHYNTEIQGLKIHYIHTKVTSDTKGKSVVPLLLLHGWPGSVREFYDIIPILSTPHDDLDVVFEIVVPSLPGYGWSQAAAKPGFGPTEMSVVLRNLMIRLGYTKFYIQGGDWGSLLGSTIATLFPDNVLGFHSNMCFLNTPLSNVQAAVAYFYPTAFIEPENVDFVFPIFEKLSNTILEMGYCHLQATKPDTIGIALSSNPVGLAVYMLEKFSTWTNGDYRKLIDGGFNQNEIHIDAILDNIMIYYLTNSITTSVRLYSEAFAAKQQAYQMDRVPTNVPVGCARFKNDLIHLMDWQLRSKYTNLVHSSFHRIGGHFVAMELPNVLHDDFVKFIKTVRKIK